MEPWRLSLQRALQPSAPLPATPTAAQLRMHVTKCVTTTVILQLIYTFGRLKQAASVRLGRKAVRPWPCRSRGTQEPPAPHLVPLGADAMTVLNAVRDSVVANFGDSGLGASLTSLQGG